MCFQINHSRNEIEFVQDMTHVGTKLRNRLLNCHIEMIMGTSKVSVAHLKDVVKNVHKSVHGLTMSDVNPTDRQNFRSFQKIVDERVLESLQQNVRGSEATIQYLKLCSNVTSSFLDYELTPVDRIYRMYQAVYFLRIWRNHIKRSRFHTLGQNFITYNAYTCIEINARSLMKLIKKFRDDNMSELFLPTIFDSQTCEKTFRQLRSMGTVNFTPINFSTYDLLHMIGRIKVQNNIAYFELSDENVSFPVSHKRSQKTKVYSMPTDIEIDATLEKAKLKAIEEATAFKMIPEDFDSYEIPSRLLIEGDETDETDDDFMMDIEWDSEYDSEFDPSFFDEDLIDSLWIRNLR